ncbi:ABC transporter ATP-binding protein [Verticiella sediminum]|uniref:ABC transporter ATP-binding protein n=1 Tax=Verticiella sediminum TaxID=1247510 RepID=A0A556AYR2_9BURK|nr:ABC transporter ATP-binding protein [Verticiella sediminum]TSH98084.1 ABC transporter ATP-binding protein [Verticiella sediminum]
MATVQLQNLVKTYGAFTAVGDLSLDVAQGEFLVLLGPSGCGKTTTLKMIAGFIEATSGSVVVGGRDVTRMPPYQRNLGVVFQNYALFPHLSVYENVAFPLRRRKVAAAQIDSKVKESLELVQMGHLAQRLPRELSGGQQQRVAIARALSFRPDVLLLDEPLSNLDAKLRLEVRQQIRHLQRDMGITTVMVTHDQEEAMSVADRLVVMQSGVVQQVGSSQEIYQRPANDFVASFIGSVNFLRGEVREGCFVAGDGVRLPGVHLPAGTRRVVVRPEAIALDAGAQPAHALHAEVLEVVYLGAHSEIVLGIAPGLVLTARVQNAAGGAAGHRVQAGQSITCSIAQDAVFALAD